MAKVLSRYTKAKDISKRQIEYTSEIDYIDALADKQQALTAGDFDRPYTFKQWTDRNIGLIADEEYKQYQQYVRDWYESRLSENQEDIKDNVIKDYAQLIQNLKFVLRDEEMVKWVENIDFNNKLELIEIIPYFARKLKEIAIYLVNKKETIKKTKLKYNLVGTQNAIEKLFYEYLLKAFTQQDYVLNIPEQNMWNTFPLLSSVKDNFQIFVEELYDDTSYFDQDPNMPASGYYDFSDPNVIEYFETLQFPVSSLDWLYQTGSTPLVINNPLFWTLTDLFNEYNVTTESELPLSAFDDVNRNRLLDYYKMDMAAKYLGTQQYILSGGYYIPKVDTFEYNFIEGNNWFYWPSGENYTEIPNGYYTPISIHDTILIESGATGSNNYEDADKIFVEKDGVLSAAWLKRAVIDTIHTTMSAQIFPYEETQNGLGFLFKFPFPDFGLSAEDVLYTGPGLSNVGSYYNILGQQTKATIDKEYWSLSPIASSIKPINIHDTNLINDHAFAAQYYNDADKIFIKRTQNENKVNDDKPDSVYTDEYENVWLYKFLKTDIPIKRGDSGNKIYWPLMRYEGSDEIKVDMLTSQCAPFALSSIDPRTDMIGARSGHGLFDADIIYKLDTPDGSPIECAFLSGSDINMLGGTTWTANTTGTIQPSFSTIIKPGTFTSFIWQDDNLNINNSTITHKNHQLDCPYLQADHESIYHNRTKSLEYIERNENGISNWQTCRCKATLYSPLGHPGDKYDDYGRLTDIIFVDTMWPESFNINEWLGTDELPYDQSADFAWYQLDENNIEPDVGWGKGKWKSGGTETFTLSTGVLYKYLRSNLNRPANDIFNNAVPPLYIKQQYENTTKPIWMRGYLQTDGTWRKTTSNTDMIIKPGDCLYYDHMNTDWYCLTTYDNRYSTIHQQLSVADIPDIDLADPSLWSSSVYTTIDKIVGWRWPSFKTLSGPIVTISDLEYVYWEITSPSGHLYKSSINHSPTPAFSIQIEEYGNYTAAATGYKFEGGSISYDSSVIPVVSSLSSIYISIPAGEIEIRTIYVDTINFTWNQNLSGWNYETSMYDITSIGARPFWAEALDDNSITTKFKGANVWGGGIQTSVIDEYTFITQPKIANIGNLDIGDAIEYRYMGGAELLWAQPIDFNVDIENKEWCKIIINPQIISPLSAYLFNLNKELVVSATEELSDIILSTQCNQYTFINYFAQDSFTWSQELTDTSLGYPPTGGLWIPPKTEIVIDPITPYANLTNRHFPTIASMPYIGGLYSKEHVGGYFTPKMLGASVYLGKQYINEFDTTYVKDDIYRDKDLFTSDYGLTKTRQSTPIETISINSNWMKSSLTQGAKAGFVENAKTYQEFIPYQSKYESKQIENAGIRNTTDDYDPWNGPDDTTWIDETNYPPDFRDEYPIESWYNQFPDITDKKLTIWKSDIFGNNYGLFKTYGIGSQYLEKYTFGELWIRNSLDQIGPANTFLSNIYNKILTPSALNIQLSSNQIYSFDLIYDTIIIETSGYVTLQQLKFDYDTAKIFSIADDVRIIDLSGGYYAGHWFHESEKLLIFCNTILNNNGIVEPYLRSYDLDTGMFRKIYNGDSDTRLFEMSSIGLSSFETPTFTYNKDTKTYNISFVSYISSGMVVGMINLDNQFNSEISMILPSNSIFIPGTTKENETKHLIASNLYNDNNLLLTFEGEYTGTTFINQFNTI